MGFKDFEMNLNALSSVSGNLEYALDLLTNENIRREQIAQVKKEEKEKMTEELLL
jgi:hypothetical protein